MADEGYTLGEDEVRRIADVVRRDEARVRGNQSRRHRSLTPMYFHAAVAKTTSTISARSGTTPGYGTATVWEINDSGVLEAVEYTDLVDMTVYSFVTSTVASGRYVIINRDRKGKWWITAEDC